MDNKEFPEQEELLAPETEAAAPADNLLPDEETVTPAQEPAASLEESVVSEEDAFIGEAADEVPAASEEESAAAIIAQDTAEEADCASGPAEAPDAEPVDEYTEAPMSDEAFQAFMMMNAVPQEDAAASAQEEPAPEAQEIQTQESVAEVPELPDAPSQDADPEEAPQEAPAEDPLAPQCEEYNALDEELQAAHALLNEPDEHSKFLDTEESTEEFSQKVHSEPAPEPIPTRDRPARKGRPRRKKGEGLFGIPNVLVTAVWLAVIVMVGSTLGRMLWVCAADVLALGREDKAVTITIYESDTIEDITQKLQNANLIKYPGLFKLYAKLAVDDGEIQPGIWDLNTRYDYHALVSMMSPSSSRSVVEVMIPEGYSCAQIFQLLEENKVCTAQDLASYAADGELDYYWFLDGIARGEENCLEGYLFPDTYQFYKNDSPRNVLQKMLNNFDYRFTDEMLQQLPALNEHISAMMRHDGRSQEYIDSHQLTLKDVVIVASLIEKETSSAQEGYTIASVIYNRLFKWGGTPSYLNIDAAMVYALGGKTDLTAEDLRIDHPYNTYLYTGLTPGPISNPGLSSLKAALTPAESPYYYYVLDPSTGDHHFSKTYEEHQAFIASMGG